jgi:hypothetical protein
VSSRDLSATLGPDLRIGLSRVSSGHLSATLGPDLRIGLSRVSSRPVSNGCRHDGRVRLREMPGRDVPDGLGGRHARELHALWSGQGAAQLECQNVILRLYCMRTGDVRAQPRSGIVSDLCSRDLPDGVYAVELQPVSTGYVPAVRWRTVRELVRAVRSRDIPVDHGRLQPDQLCEMRKGGIHVRGGRRVHLHCMCGRGLFERARGGTVSRLPHRRLYRPNRRGFL